MHVYTLVFVPLHLVIIINDVMWDFIFSSHSHPQRPRPFWSAPRIATSSRVQFSKHAQRIRFVLSANQFCHT